VKEFEEEEGVEYVEEDVEEFYVKFKNLWVLSVETFNNFFNN
jgi:hypothetical protein